MGYLSDMLTLIKGRRLVKYEVIEGSVKSGKFKLLLEYDGIIVKGKTMTINQLADIMNKRFDKIESRLDEHDVILKEYGAILKEYGEIFKRNNLK